MVIDGSLWAHAGRDYNGLHCTTLGHSKTRQEQLSKPNVTQLNSKQLKSNFVGLDIVPTCSPPPPHNKLFRHF